MFIEKLLNLFKKDEKSDSKLPVEYALEAETKRKTGDFQAALKLINKAVEEEPDNDMFYITRALIYQSLNDKKSALADVKKALEINPKIEKTKALQKELLENI